jgi:Protein of unknown function (DUF3383)
MLSVSNLVNVTINLSTLGAVGRSFTTLMIAGDSNVINGLQRYRTYTDIEDVGADFGSTAPEYLAAALYFSQSPQPATLQIGRWLRTATSGQNLGAILNATQANIANFNAISNGSFSIDIDGTVQNLTGINFNGATNLNAVASAVNLVLTGAICTWNGQEFIITSNSSGAGLPASGSIMFTAAGTPGDTITIGGTSIELVASSPSGSQVLIGANANATAGNLQTFLQNSADVNISQCTYSLSGPTITVTYKLIGVAGNSFTLAKSSTAITLSGATLSGGAVPSSVGYATTYSSGTDISSLLGLTAALSIALVPGYAAETPVQCATVLTGLTSAFYGLMFAASVMPTDDQSLDVSTYVEALEITRLYGVTTQETGALSSLVTNDLGSLMELAEYDQSMIQYSSTSPYAIASLFGRAFGVDFTAANSTIDLMYKQEPGVVPENITDAEAAVLKAKNINVFASYENGTQLIQYGVCSSGQAIDTIQGADWFQNDVQTDVFNVLYESDTKIPQTDAGINQLTNACTAACQDAINNGFAAPGIWNGPSFGSLVTGQYLKNGYYVFAQSVDTQSQSDRDQRIAPPIQIALKLAGAVNTVPDLLVTINQ